MYTVSGSGLRWQCRLGMFNDGMKRLLMALNWVLTDGLETNKILFHILISAACECMENYG